MNHLNYFEPFQSKKAGEEDQLTRAFLVVLRHSRSSLVLFYDLVREKCRQTATEYGIAVDLPAPSSLEWNECQLATQKGTMEGFITSTTISVLLTDEKVPDVIDVHSSSRGARYDGLIGISNQVTLVVENKPRNWGVWNEQLSPNLEGHTEDTKVVEVAAIIEWRSVIRMLENLSQSPILGGAEKTLISDFMDFVAEYFPYLTPFDRLDLCRSREMVTKRVLSLLRTITVSEDEIVSVKWWEPSVRTNLDAVKYVFVEIPEDYDRSHLRLSIYPGDTIAQARSFYGNVRSFEPIQALMDKGWECRTNFHLAFMSTNLTDMYTPRNRIGQYFDYWSRNIARIQKIGLGDLRVLLEELEKEKLVVNDESTRKKLGDEIFNTRRQWINVCPGFCIWRDFPFKKLIDLDRKEELAFMLAGRIREVLAMLGKPLTFLRN